MRPFVAKVQVSAAGLNQTYRYTYDANGNILSVSDGTNTTSYVYDSANQLVRENNQAGGFTHVWTYDRAGNILSRTEYAYTTGTIGEALDTVVYNYGDSQWGDLLTGYDGRNITSDAIGNPLSDGIRSYTWEHGRQLATVTQNGVTWQNTYNADGLRTKRTDGTNTYEYVYYSGLLQYMEHNGQAVYFTHAPDGTPMGMLTEGNAYFYITNLQGDVVGILDSTGAPVVHYTYDVWGNLLSTTGSLASTIGVLNPIRYRGYVYDTETQLYYLQSRYYDPEIGRFINADAFTSTGQGLTGNNMFAYCGNNPVNYVDPTGCLSQFFKDIADWIINNPIVDFGKDIAEDIENYDASNQSEEKVIKSNYFSNYKGILVIRTNGDRSGSFGAIFLTRETNTRRFPEDVLRHEYGHTKQLEQLGIINYAFCIALPSWQQWGTGEYYSKPFEITADIYGDVQSRDHSQGNINKGFAYLWGSRIIGPLIWLFID